jgi:septum formation protein
MNSLESKLNNFPYQIILGSASPRRQELLKGLGFTFAVKPTHADETFPAHLAAAEIPRYLAKKKADAFTEELKENDLLITADTVVWCEGRIYNKPDNYEDGTRMLNELSGKMHEVFTAVCIKGRHKELLFHDTSRVYFKQFGAEEIDYYLTHFKPYDKAGAYGVQDWLGYTGIERIEGSFYNVMGLPVKPLYDALIGF